MVIIKLQGGLGNQMFQYASAKAIALHRKQELKIDHSNFETYDLHSYGLDHFNIKAEKQLIGSKSTFFNKLAFKYGLKKEHTHNETDFKFNENKQIFNIKTNDLILHGYYQTEKYFKKYRNEILADFEIKGFLKPETEAMLSKIRSTNAVSIHIRRGDYLLHDVHNTSKDAYYKAAMEFIESKIENPVYYLFSDDMKWVKENFKSKHEMVYVDFNDASTNYQDIKLMSNCKHNVIANSSFSWWSAWLNKNPEKLVIAPKVWFNGDMYDYTDIVPETWYKF